MKKVFLLTFLLSFTFTVKAQSFLSLDSCRALALANNKDLLISNEKISAAHYQRKAAFTNYLPNFSATGAYMRNQKEFSLLNNDQKAALSGLGTNLAGPIQQAATEIATAHPDLAPLISSLSGKLGAVLPALDQAGNSLVDALRTDTRNVYAGAITLTQPLYMGGKIRAYNKITKYAEELAQEQHHGGMQEVIMSTDQAYWQVISLVNKKKLAEGYLKLLQQLDSDVEKMINEGVATKADGLSVRVKVNEAEMTLTKVEDGLSLARMLLCQLCGIDLSSPITLADENMEDIPLLTTDPHFDLSTAYENRPEIRSLELATQIYKQKVNVTRAEHLPSIALMGNYMVTNPSVFNSFENKFKGMWNVGVMVQIPIWHWGEGIYKTRAAKAEARIAQYQLQDAREKIELQVNQAAFKVKEAGKKLVMSSKNMEEAKQMLKNRRAYGIIYIPSDFSDNIAKGKQTQVSIYCDMSGLLYYKSMLLANTAVSLDMNRDIKIARSGNTTDRQDEITAYPIEYEEISIFNPTAGFAAFLIPAVLVLIIQQTLLLGIGLAAGTTRENNRFKDLVPINRHYNGTLRIVLGKGLSYFLVYILVAFYVLYVVPRLFSLNQIGQPSSLILFVVPYLAACIFFAMTASIAIRNRETCMLIFVFTSVPLLFISGISWPGAAIPPFWKYVSYIFPSTFGINGFVKINNMGATLSEVAFEYKALWLQAGIYFLTTCWVYRWQILMSRKHAIERYKELKEKANLSKQISD